MAPPMVTKGMFVMLDAAMESARAWTAPALWSFDPAPSNTSAPSNPRTIPPHYQFTSNIL